MVNVWVLYIFLVSTLDRSSERVPMAFLDSGAMLCCGLIDRSYMVAYFPGAHIYIGQVH